LCFSDVSEYRCDVFVDISPATDAFCTSLRTSAIARFRERQRQTDRQTVRERERERERTSGCCGVLRCVSVSVQGVLKVYAANGSVVARIPGAYLLPKLRHKLGKTFNSHSSAS